jgi:hypothetical protein
MQCSCISQINSFQPLWLNNDGVEEHPRASPSIPIYKMSKKIYQDKKHQPAAGG